MLRSKGKQTQITQKMLEFLENYIIVGQNSVAGLENIKKALLQTFKLDDDFCTNETISSWLQELNYTRKNVSI